MIKEVQLRIRLILRNWENRIDIDDHKSYNFVGYSGKSTSVNKAGNALRPILHGALTSALMIIRRDSLAKIHLTNQFLLLLRFNPNVSDRYRIQMSLEIPARSPQVLHTAYFLQL